MSSQTRCTVLVMFVADAPNFSPFVILSHMIIIMDLIRGGSHLNKQATCMSYGNALCLPYNLCKSTITPNITFGNLKFLPVNLVRAMLCTSKLWCLFCCILNVFSMCHITTATCPHDTTKLQGLKCLGQPSRIPGIQQFSGKFVRS